MQKHKTAIFLKHKDGQKAFELVGKRNKVETISKGILMVSLLMIFTPIILKIIAEGLEITWLIAKVNLFITLTWARFSMALLVFSFLFNFCKPETFTISQTIFDDISELSRICSVTTDALYESSETESFLKFAEKVLIEKAYAIIVTQGILANVIRSGRSSANRMIRNLLEREENRLKVELRKQNAILHKFGAGREDIGWAFEEAEKMM